MTDETDEPDSAAHPFTRLTPDLVMDATESVGFQCDARILELNSYENRVYQIGIEDDEPVIGKFYRPERWTESQILEEHSYTQLLADSDISEFHFDAHVGFSLILRSGTQVLLGFADPAPALDRLSRMRERGLNLDTPQRIDLDVGSVAIASPL